LALLVLPAVLLLPSFAALPAAGKKDGRAG